MPQDPTGSGSSSSSSSSSSDLAESDDRNDDDDENRLAWINASCMFDQPIRPDEDTYETVANNERPLEFLATSRETPYDSRSVSKVADYRRRYDDFQRREYTETALTEPVNGLRDYSSSSANSLDDLCQGHQGTFTDFSHAETANTRDHYMVPTRDPRELNERILSLFNPQFLPNFNDMFMYVANQCDGRQSPPPRSRSMAEGEDQLFKNSSCRKKRVGASSMFFRRGLAYETARK